MLRQEVKKILDELDSCMISQKTELLIKKLLVASVEIYELPHSDAICHSYDTVFENPDAPSTLTD